jgi:Phage minor capsid protein 2
MGYLDKNGMPTPSYKRDKEKFIKLLDGYYRQMLDYLILQLQFNPDEPHVIREVEIMRQINYWLKEMDKDVAKQLEKLIKKTFKDGQAYHLLSVKEAKNWEDAVSSASFNKVVRGKVEALFADTYGDILLATQNTEESIKKVVRETVSKVAQYHSLKNTRYTEQVEQLVKELSKQGLSEKITKEGFVGIQDAKGRRWDLRVYSKMVITTKVNQAFIEGIMHESEETGFDLAVISDHNAEDACRKWEGMVISLTGKTKGFITYKEARATNEIWHPNCEHTLHPIRSLDMLHPDDIALHEKKMREIGDVKKRVYKRKSAKKSSKN